MMQLSARFEDALGYAARLHATQVRKGSGMPYVAHLLAVASLVLEQGADEDVAIAALLHDAVEDQGGVATRGEIAARFGEAVAKIVDDCTDTDQQPKPPWRARKEAYLAHLAHAGPASRLVSAADKLHNARSLLADYRQVGEAVWDRFTASKSETLWYYRAVTLALSQPSGNGLTEELARTVAELEALAASGV